MSNAFDKLMAKSANHDEQSASGAGGRPMHEHWYGYQKIYVNQRVTAKCRNCSKVYLCIYTQTLQKLDC